MLRSISERNVVPFRSVWANVIPVPCGCNGAVLFTSHRAALEVQKTTRWFWAATRGPLNSLISEGRKLLLNEPFDIHHFLHRQKQAENSQNVTETVVWLPSDPSPTPLPHTDLRTCAVRQAAIRLESDVWGIDKTLHFFSRLGAKHKRNHGVSVSVALQHVHVLISTVGGGLRIEEIRITVLLSSHCQRLSFSCETLLNLRFVTVKWRGFRLIS